MIATRLKAMVRLLLVGTLILASARHAAIRTDMTAGTRASPRAIPGPPPIDYASLLQRLSTPPQLTPAQREEDRRMDREMAAAAIAELGSPREADRVGAAEQLGAYPVPAADIALARTLRTDASAAVRLACAISLANFDELSRTALTALQGALADGDENVRGAAFSTLQAYLETRSPDSPALKSTVKALGKLTRSQKLDPETRQLVRELLAGR
jgi:hypothetical protein